jgi:CO/xanthine dehydrogenase Mo-binding subunit
VKYIEDRMEYLLAGGGQSWDRYYDAALAVRADGTVTGFRVKLLDDQGASAEGYGTISVAKPLAAFTGCYRIEAAQYDVKVVSTNRAPSYPYRGYGPPPHNFVLESLMDIAARGLGLDTAEMRRRNYIRPEQFPYTIPSGNEYDSGNYEAALDKVLEMADYGRLREEQARARAEGRLVGIGVASTIEPGVFDWNAYATVGVPGVGVPEGASVGINILGEVTVRVGFNLQGQGQYTLAAQLLADYFGVEMDAVRVVYADTDNAPPHFGPGGSRLGVAITGAILGACQAITEKLRHVAAVLLQAPFEQVECSWTGCSASGACPGRRCRWRRSSARCSRAATCCRRAWRRMPPRPVSGPRRGAPHPTPTDAARAISPPRMPATWCWSKWTPKPARPRS